MTNLLAGTGIGTVFVDNELRIQRFTPAATQVINLIESDVGRPVGHLVSNLVGYDSLVGDVQQVLDTLETREIEVLSRDGQWYLLRIRPYRTDENVIEGAAITFTEITDLKNAEKAALDAQMGAQRLSVVLDDSSDAVLVFDLEGTILAWNQRASRMYGWSEAEALSMSIEDLVAEGDREGALSATFKHAGADSLTPTEIIRLTKDGRQVRVALTASFLLDAEGTPYAIATTEREGTSHD